MGEMDKNKVRTREEKMERERGGREMEGREKKEQIS